MSEVTSRPQPTRGRGAGRGGRGGARGSTRGRDRATNGTFNDTTQPEDDAADQGELGEMKKQYSSQLSTLKELFSDWTDVDLLFALQETDGDLTDTIERITEGHVSKFSDVKSTKEKSKPKPKDSYTTPVDASTSSRSTRGRGGPDAVRGGRGRPERGRGGFRGGRGAAHSAVRAPSGIASTATTDSPAWDTSTSTEDTVSGAKDAPSETTAQAVAQEPTSSTLAEAPKKTWAQMFAKPLPAPVPQPKSIAEPVPLPEAGVTPSEASSSGYVEVTHADAEPEGTAVVPDAEIAGHEPPTIDAPEDNLVQLTPSKDQLTKENVEHLPDMAHPAPTGTAASEVESSRGPDSVTPSIAGVPPAPAPIGRPLGGFQTTAYKATGAGGRSASFHRRLLEQQEAVVMPGNHAADRTAVQFGSLGLNGDGPDVDEDREDTETRAQPPQHSPVAAPRASLPPVSRQAGATAEAAVQDTPTTSKATTGLPPAPTAHQSYSHQSPDVSSAQAQQGSHSGQGYGQFARYGQSDSASQKSYDPFGQQLPQQSAYDAYPSQSQAPNASQSVGGFTSSANDYSSYYSADQRNAYSNYYNAYGQQHSSGQQDNSLSQQRAVSGFGASADTGYPTAQHGQASSRFGENQQSGHTTPNPASSGQQHGNQSSGSQHAHQQQQQQQQQHGQNQHGGYPGYGNHPYFNSPYYASYMNQYSPYGQQGFGGPYNNSNSSSKGGMFNQPHHGYGQNAYEQSSSSAGGFGRDSGLSGSLGDYGRSNSTQPSQTGQSGNSGYGGASDPFGRTQSGYSGQNQGYGQSQSGQQGSGEDSLKPFGDSKSGSGPSPSSLGQTGRPGSATNTTAQGSQSGLPPPQSHQHAGFGGYPGGHLGQMGSTSQYGSGLGGLGGQSAGSQSHQGGGYGSGYGAGFGGNSYGSYGRGGWGQNYGGH